ncbi:MAG: MFS transporter [Nocardioides sp.]|nr:MFS transporter [Nocardioides sp.]
MASASLIWTFFASGTPVPLYNTYRAENGLTSADLVLTTVVYLASTAAALLVLGRLSDHLGRRPIAALALASSLAGALVLMHVEAVGWLVAGRVLQGVACGMASSALGSYVIDTAPRRPPWLAAVITSTAPQLSIPVGALVAGSLVDLAPAPRVLVYAFVATGLGLGILLVALCPETVGRRSVRGGLAALRPQVAIPAGAGPAMLVAGGVAVATWSLGGFFQGYSPMIASERLGSDNALLVAVVLASLMLLAPLGGAAGGRWSPRTSVAVGMLVFAASTVVIVVGIVAGTAVLLVVAELVAAFGMGMAAAGGLRGAIPYARTDERAGLLAAIYLVSYLGAAVPSLVSSRLVEHLSLVTIAVGHGTLAVAVSLATVGLALRTPAPARA